MATQNTHQRGLYRVVLKNMIVCTRVFLRTETAPRILLFATKFGCTAVIMAIAVWYAFWFTPLYVLPSRQPEQNGEESLLPKRKEDNHLDAHELPKWANWFEQLFESLVAVSAKQRKQRHRFSLLVAHIQTITSMWANSELAESKETLT